MGDISRLAWFLLKSPFSGSPAVFGRNRFHNMDMQNLNQIIPLIVIVVTCVVSFIGFDNSLFFQRYMFQVGAVRYSRQYRRLLTSGFLHADWMHLLFNMFTLFFFARPITYWFGWEKFLMLYFAALLSGSLFSLWLYRRRPSYAAIGASGAVSGVLFAAITVAPMMELYFFFVPMTAWIFGTLYFAYSVYMMLNPKRWDNLGHAAHIGGAAAGIVFAALFAFPLLMKNALYIGIMLLPLLYLAYELLLGKRIR